MHAKSRVNLSNENEDKQTSIAYNAQENARVSSGVMFSERHSKVEYSIIVGFEVCQAHLQDIM